jgi:hypothetical protein
LNGSFSSPEKRQAREHPPGTQRTVIISIVVVAFVERLQPGISYYSTLQLPADYV